MPSPHDERGSVTVWMALAALAMVLIVGIAVDLGGQIHAQQRASDIAAQAARTAGNQVHATTAMRGQPVTVDADRARTAAETYLRTAGVTGTARVSNADLHVTAQITYQPVFLGAAGIGPQQVTGEASARLARAVEGTER